MEKQDFILLYHHVRISHRILQFKQNLVHFVEQKVPFSHTHSIPNNVHKKVSLYQRKAHSELSFKGFAKFHLLTFSSCV